MKINKGNILIAEFMGGKRNIDGDIFEFANDYEMTSIYIKDMRFHCSLDWLLPVLNKLIIVYNNNGYKIDNELLYSYTIFNNVRSLWKIVLKLIKVYNKIIKLNDYY